MDTFCNRLREIRRIKGLTQTELGQIVGASRRMISQYENGDGMPSLEMVRKLAQYFHITTDYLLGIDNYLLVSLDGFSRSEQRMIFEIIDMLSTNRKSNSS